MLWFLWFYLVFVTCLILHFSPQCFTQVCAGVNNRLSDQSVLEFLSFKPTQYLFQLAVTVICNKQGSLLILTSNEPSDRLQRNKTASMSLCEWAGKERFYQNRTIPLKISYIQVIKSPRQYKASYFVVFERLKTSTCISLSLPKVELIPFTYP